MNPNLQAVTVPRRTLRQQLARPTKVAVSAGELWLNAEGLRMSAAMSFYGVLSLRVGRDSCKKPQKRP